MSKTVKDRGILFTAVALSVVVSLLSVVVSLLLAFVTLLLVYAPEVVHVFKSIQKYFE